MKPAVIPIARKNSASKKRTVSVHSQKHMSSPHEPSSPHRRTTPSPTRTPATTHQYPPLYPPKKHLTFHPTLPSTKNVAPASSALTSQPHKTPPSTPSKESPRLPTPTHHIIQTKSNNIMTPKTLTSGSLQPRPNSKRTSCDSLSCLPLSPANPLPPAGPPSGVAQTSLSCCAS